jgi:hypothetical protein
MRNLQRLARILVLFGLLAAGSVSAQERFSIFVGSDPANVERMLKLAKLRDDDRVIDLGSGDGRIVIAAVRGTADSVWLEGVRLHGDSIAFSTEGRRFVGRIAGDEARGTLTAAGAAPMPWRAVRVGRR